MLKPIYRILFPVGILVFVPASQAGETESGGGHYKPKFAEQWPEVYARLIETWPESKIKPTDETIPGSLKLPLPFFGIRPGRTALFGWDPYYTNVGLLHIDALAPFAKNAAENQMAEIEQIGFVPNANEPWGLNRAQTPHLSMMVRDVYERSLADKAWLARAYEMLRREYKFWVDDSADAIEVHTTSIPGLQRFSHHATEAELLNVYARLAGRFHFPEGRNREEQLAIANNWLPAAETMDFTPRFEDRCPDFIPVDLNALLYLYECNFAWLVDELGLEGEPNWRALAERRKDLLTTYCWDSERGLFLDYDQVNRRFSSVASVVTFYPMWVGMATKAQAARIVENIGLFEHEYGPTVCEEGPREHLYQWDFPAGWPPIYYIVANGLRKYGYTEAARRIAGKYLDVVSKNFYSPSPTNYQDHRQNRKVERSPGFAYEKYEVVHGTLWDAEYPSRTFHGWSIGVFVWSYHFWQETKNDGATNDPGLK